MVIGRRAARGEARLMMEESMLRVRVGADLGWLHEGTSEASVSHTRTEGYEQRGAHNVNKGGHGAH